MRIIIFITVMLSTTLAFTQKQPKLVIPKDTITYKLEFTIQNTPKNGFKIIPKNSISSKGIFHTKTLMKDADLILQTLLASPNKKQKFEYRMELRDSNNQLLTKSNTNFVNQDRPQKNKITTNTMIWKNITEGKIFPKSNYSLTYYIDRYRTLGFNCDNPPTFNWKEHLYFSPGIIIGGGMMIYSQRNLRRKADKYYDMAVGSSIEYTNLWEKGTTIDNSELIQKISENERFIEQGDKFGKQSEDVFNIGVTILIIDGLIYIGHWVKQILDKKLYNEFCSTSDSGLTIRPYSRTPFNSYEQQQLGLALTYTF